MNLDDVPNYLKNSPLYLSFLENQKDDNEEIFIEDRFLKDNFELNNLNDLENLLDTLNFWLIEDEKIPYYEIFLFVKNNKKIYEFDNIINKFFNMKVILGISNLYFSKNKDLLYNIIKTDDIYLYKYYKKLRFKYKPSLLNKSFIVGNCAFEIFKYEFNKIFNKNDINYVLNIYDSSNNYIYNEKIRDIFFREFKKCNNKSKIIPYIFDYLKNLNINNYIIDVILLTKNLELINSIKDNHLFFQKLFKIEDNNLLIEILFSKKLELINLIKNNQNFIYLLFKIEDINLIIKIINYFNLEDYKTMLLLILINKKYEIFEYYKIKFNNIILEYKELEIIMKEKHSNEIIKYIEKNNINIKYDDLIKTNHTLAIELLYNDDYIFNNDDINIIISNDNVKILNFIYLKSYRKNNNNILYNTLLNENIFYNTLLYNSYLCIKFLFNKACPFDRRIYNLLEHNNKSTNYIYNKINNKKILFVKYYSTINNEKIIKRKYIFSNI